MGLSNWSPEHRDRQTAVWDYAGRTFFCRPYGACNLLCRAARGLRSPLQGSLAHVCNPPPLRGLTPALYGGVENLRWNLPMVQELAVPCVLFLFLKHGVTCVGRELPPQGGRRPAGARHRIAVGDEARRAEEPTVGTSKGICAPEGRYNRRKIPHPNEFANCGAPLGKLSWHEPTFPLSAMTNE